MIATFSACLRRSLAAALLALPALCLAATLQAKPMPQPPCPGLVALPGFATPGPRPAIDTWFDDDIDPDWQPPACLGWQAQPMDVLIATAGRFEAAAGGEAITARMAAISDLTAMRYWSVTRQIWRPLVTEAFALAGPDKARRRPDFAPDELRAGATLYFWQDENTPAGGLVYRLQVREHTADRIVLALENAAPVSFLLLPLFAAGEYQTVVFLEHESGTLWRYYSLQRARNNVSLSTRDHRASYVNRAAALFRHLAGFPTDLEPPLAPQ